MSYTKKAYRLVNRISLWIALAAGMIALLLVAQPANAATAPVLPPYWIKDFDNGTQSARVDSNDLGFRILESRALFCARDKPDSKQIWVTNLAGVTQRIPIENGIGNSCPKYAGALNGFAIYKTQGLASSQYTLWRTDGTSSGTLPFFTATTSALDYDIQSSAVFSNQLYFSGNYSLWRTDGTAQGTANISNTNSLVYGMAVMSDSLYLVTTDFYHYWELWRSDGTAAGMQLIKRITDTLQASEVNQPLPSPSPYYFPKIEAVNGNLFINTRYQVWISDGTAAGTVKLARINYNPNMQIHSEAYKNQVAYVIEDFSNFPMPNNQLWLTDGTLSGTHQMTEISKDLSSIKATADWLYVSANGGLWKTNGTVGSVQRATSFPSQPLMAWQNQMLLIARPIANAPTQLMVTDNTPAGAHQLLNLPLNEDGTGFTADNFADFNGKLLFWDTRRDIGIEPYISDGTDAGTHLLRDINATPNSGNLNVVATSGQQLYFMASDLAHERGLWVTQGNANDAVFLHELPPSTFSGDYTPTPDRDRLAKPTFLNNVLLYAAPMIGANSVFSEAIPHVLWRSDGTPSGTYTLTDNTAPIDTYTPLGYADTRPIGILVGSYCYFVSGQTLWRTDGTRAGTTRVKQFENSLFNSTLVESKGVLYLNEITVSGIRLWRSDGTDAGTTIVATLPTIQYLVATSQAIFFSDLNQLWTSDGTPTGTTILRTETVTPTGVSSLMAAGDKLFFVADDGIHGRELWTTDGSIAGTHLTRDLTPGISETFPVNDSTAYFYRFGSKVLFGRSLDSSSAKIWISDGTLTGTYPLGDGDLSTWNNAQVNASATQMLFLGGSILWRTDGTVTGTVFITNTAQNAAFIGDTLIFLRTPKTWTWLTPSAELWWLNPDAQVTQRIIDLPLHPSDSFYFINNHLVFIESDADQIHRLMAWPIPQPSSDGVDLSLQVPTLAPINEAGKLNLPITLMNNGQTKAQSVTLTLELGAGMAYQSDTSGQTPQVQGNQVHWQFSELPFLTRANFAIQLQAPRIALGTRSPFTLTLQSASPDSDPIDNGIQSQAWTSIAWYLPIVQR